MKPKRFNQYLRDSFETNGVIDHHVRISHIDEDGCVHFFIHSQGSDDLEFVAQGVNVITPKDVYEARYKGPTGNA